jgi:hypothetical protein
MWIGIAPTLVLFLLLLCLLPPDGVLSDNEENYFQLGAHLVSAGPISPDSAVLDGSWHRVVNDALLGGLVRLVGFTAGQMIARTLAALAYAVALRALFRRFGLSTIDAVLVVVIFGLMGQTLVGREWLFNGYEAKVAAYCLVLAGLAMVLDGRRDAAVLLFAAATHFHFLVGGFWFLAAAAFMLIAERGHWRPFLRPVLLFGALVAPIIGLIAATRLLGEPSVPDPTLPTPDVIYAFIRAPHHTAPFLSLDNFISQWLPGLMLAAGMFAACFAVRGSAREARLISVATWLALLLAYLLLALIPSFLDRHTGTFGKFYLFRPSSLILLLWLALALAWLNRVALARQTMLKPLALLLVLPPFLLDAGNRIAGDLARGDDLGADKRAVIDILARNSAVTAVVLIDPALDLAFLDFERLSGRPMLVSWKFDPTNDPEILEWQRRMEFRRALFAEGCAGSLRYRVDFLLAQPEHAAELTRSCGPVIYSGKAVTLLRRSG